MNQPPARGIPRAQPTHPAPVTPGKAAAPAHPPLLPLDTLPDTAFADPEFRNGPATTLASGHPALALKYGIRRNGVTMKPSKDGTAWVPEVASPPVSASPEEVTPGKQEPRSEQEEASKEELQEAAYAPNDFDLARLRELVVRDLLNNDIQRRKIEARLTPIDPIAAVKGMIIGTRLTQLIPIIPGVFEPTFEQLPFSVENRLQAMIVLEVGNLDIAKVHLMDKYALWGMMCALKALKGINLPSIYEDDGRTFSEKRFELKMNVLFNLPTELIASLMVHYSWFSLRVRAALQVADIKNG